jgi:hypothetical protein
MRTPAEFRAYFEDLATAHPLIKSFFEGNYEEILAAERSTMEYPLLWLESPEVTIPDDEDGFQISFNSAFVILYNSPMDDYLRIKSQMESAYRMAMDVVFKMLSDSNAGNFDFTIKNIALDPVSTLNNDNDHGWRCNFSILIESEGCGNSEIWPESFPFGEFARFELTDKDSTKMTFETDAIDDSEDYTINWYVESIVDGDKEIENFSGMSELDWFIPKKYEQVYIQLTLNYIDYQKHASMHIIEPVPGMKSVPFIYNPLI